MAQRQSTGFSVIEIIVVLFVALAVVLGGWYIWHRHNASPTTAKKIANNATHSNKQVDSKDRQDDTPADPAEGGKYLVIKEWGVRIPLPQSLQGDISYGLQTYTYGQGASFESAKLASLPGANCRLITEPDGSGQSGGIGDLLVRKDVPFTSAEAAQYDASNITIDNHWYGVAITKASCLTTEDSSESEIDHSLGDALKQVAPIPQN